MRRLILLFALFLVGISYASDKTSPKSREVAKPASFIGLDIASIDFFDAKELTTSSTYNLNAYFTNYELNKMFNDFVRKYDIKQANYSVTRIETIKGKPYLRSYSADGFVATTGLDIVHSVEKNAFVLRTEGITCRSQRGCLPNGTYCIKDGLSEDDCTKTVTSE